MPDSALTFTSMIVSSFLGKNQTSRGDLSTLIQTVHTALTEAVAPAPEPAVPQAPAVSARRSITPDAIICMDCGKPFKSLRRHLKTAHNLSPRAYLAKWNLPKTYPMVAQTYSAARSAFAKRTGLGARRQAASPEEGPHGTAPVSSTAAEPANPPPSSAVSDSQIQAAEEAAAREPATARAASKPKAAVKAKPHPKPSATPKPKGSRAAKSAGT